MKSLWKCLVQSAIVIGVSTCSTTTVLAQSANEPGVVRITKAKTNPASDAKVVQVSAQVSDPNCTSAGAPSMSCDSSMICTNCCSAGMGNGYCGCGRQGWGGQYEWGGQNRWGGQNWRNADWQTSDSMGAGFRARTQAQSLALEQAMGGPIAHRPYMANHDESGHAMLDYLRCKFGYFIPSGGGGKGVPWVGHYARVYPVNPHYSDPRDGQAYAAQGYGVPMAVPLAPVVGHTYEYGWGIPSSRLTPVSHPAY